MLRDLFLITFVDLYCVGPGNLTSWKDELLRDLFQRTAGLSAPRSRPADGGAAQAARRRKREACKKLSLSPDDPRVAAILGGLPDRYFVENSPPRSPGTCS
jgi:UTP:GlnB (protein PII) uridylyltransferase